MTLHADDSEDSSDIALCGLGVLSLSECLTLSVVSHQVEVKNLGKVGSLGSNCLCYSLRRLCTPTTLPIVATLPLLLPPTTLPIVETLPLLLKIYM